MKTKAISPITYLTGLLLVLTTSIFTSCQDEITSAGIELMPDAGYFVPLYDETTGMTAQNTTVPIRTDDALNGTLGVYEDPIFGTIKSDFLLQMLPQSIDTIKVKKYTNTEKQTFTEELELDGLYLHFPIKDTSWLGDSTAVHKVKVYELVDNLSQEKYYANMTVDGLYNQTSLAEQELKASNGKNIKNVIKREKEGKPDSVYYTWNSSSSWKIKMPDELAQRFWELAKNPPYNPKSEDDAVRNVFLNYFKGLYITSELVDPSKTSYIPFSFMSSTPLRLVLSYKRKKTTTTIATGSKTETITDETVTYFSTYERKRIARALPLTSGSIPSEPGNAENLYIQGMSGRAAKIQMDTEQLYGWKDSLDQGNRRIGFSNIELILAVDKPLADTAKHDPVLHLQFWIKRRNGELTDKPSFISGVNYGYVFENLYSSTSQLIPYGSLNSDLTYTFKLNPKYFEAYLYYMKNPTDSAEFFHPDGRYYHFADKNSDGSYKYIYDLDELLLMSASANREDQSTSVANNIKRVVLESPTHADTKTKLKIKYFAY